MGRSTPPKPNGMAVIRVLHATARTSEKEQAVRDIPRENYEDFGGQDRNADTRGIQFGYFDHAAHSGSRECESLSLQIAGNKTFTKLMSRPKVGHSSFMLCQMASMLGLETSSTHIRA
jgi:hypothetical protein